MISSFLTGNPISVELVLKAFKEFSLSSGLDVNPYKCKVYFGNICKVDQQVITNMSKFSSGLVPFKYLGIPISNKKMRVQECMILVDKILVKIRHWNSKLLNYAGRVQLIKSVLFPIVNNWMQCIPILKKVINAVEAICRSYLWSRD